jgi:hypothetical protein
MAHILLFPTIRDAAAGRLRWAATVRELQAANDNAPNLMDDEHGRGCGFPETLPAIVAFTDLMTATLEAVMIHQELLRLHSRLSDTFSRQAV